MTTVSRGTCPDPELLTALVDAELDHVSRDDVLSHLASCADCRALVEAERRAKAAVRELPASDAGPVPSADLMARLRAVPVEVARVAAEVRPEPQVASLDERRARRASRTPAYLGAAASVVVFMVGAFAYLGAGAQARGPAQQGGTTAIVPAADRLALEHAATSSQVGVGGPGYSAVSVSVPISTSGAAAP